MISIKTTDLFDLEHTLASDLFIGADEPWSVLPGLKKFILALGETLDKSVYEERQEGIWIARDAVIAPSAYLSAPLIVDSGAELRHCAFIRGSVIIGKNCVVGNSSELKNCVFFDNVQVPHFNYIGDSILGYRSHMGAGSITSNVKSDKTLVSIKREGEEIQTGLKKLGALVGDYVEVGCNAVLNPGTVLGRNSTVYPTSCVRGCVPENHIYKVSGVITPKK